MIHLRSELILTLFLPKYGKKMLLHRHKDMVHKIKHFVITLDFQSRLCSLIVYLEYLSAYLKAFDLNLKS